jgi:isoquinoline 1-oxidoreductase alpha subunit
MSKPSAEGVITLTVNGKTVETDAPGDTPLLWVLRDRLGLTGTKYGCGIGACGACTVHVDGKPELSCGLRIASLAGAEVTTIEGLSPDGGHPLQRAWVAEQVPQCGYCQSGQIMRAAALLADNPAPSREEIVEAMRLHICRCGTYLRIMRAIERAARANPARAADDPPRG